MIQKTINDLMCIEQFDIMRYKIWSDSQENTYIKQYVDHLLQKDDFDSNRTAYRNAIMLLLSVITGDDSSIQYLQQQVTNNNLP